jgi:hypothetical protein
MLTRRISVLLGAWTGERTILGSFARTDPRVCVSDRRHTTGRTRVQLCKRAVEHRGDFVGKVDGVVRVESHLCCRLAQARLAARRPDCAAGLRGAAQHRSRGYARRQSVRCGGIPKAAATSSRRPVGRAGKPIHKPPAGGCETGAPRSQCMRSGLEVRVSRVAPGRI